MLWISFGHTIKDVHGFFCNLIDLRNGIGHTVAASFYCIDISTSFDVWIQGN
jgi:hypothetical protein